MTNDVTEVDCGIGVAMDMLIKEPIKIIVYIFTLVSISFVLTVEALTLLCVSCFVVAIVGKTMKKLALLGQQCIGRILSTFEETLGKLKFIKIFNLSTIEQKEKGFTCKCKRKGNIIKTLIIFYSKENNCICFIDGYYSGKSFSIKNNCLSIRDTKIAFENLDLEDCEYYVKPL